MKRFAVILALGLISISFFSTDGDKPRSIENGFPAHVDRQVIRSFHSIEAFGFELFEGEFPPGGWELVNPNAGSITFSKYVGANGPSIGGNASAMIDFYSYSSTGHRDSLFTPVYQVTAVSDSFKFDWAYAQYSASYRDSLIVLMSADGGTTFPYVLFRRGGATLATAPSTTDPFVPANSSQWGKFSVSLIGQASVCFVFVTYNAYGNNLYIDNVSVGTQVTQDVTPVSIVNIAPDTTYSTGSGSYGVMPEVVIANLGTSDIVTSFDVTMTMAPGGYSSTKNVPLLNSGASTVVTFDNLTVTPGNPMNFTVYTSLAGDSLADNDTLHQYSMILPGTSRNVLLEEWTSSTCGPCAANNPTIVAFVETNWDDIVAVKYHVGWPAPGNDPMYLHNPTQSYDRRYYYGVNAAPTVIMDGQVYPAYPYSTPGSLEDAFGQRSPKGSPVEVTVTSSRIAIDSIRAEVTVDVLSPLTEGAFYVRVQAIERLIWYTGPNGEPEHYDVFRRSYPGSTGTPLPNVVGTHIFTFDYQINPVWSDTMIYTIAFVQNDLTKEVANAGKSERTHYVVGISPSDPPARFALGQNYPNPFNPTTSIAYELATDTRVVLKIYNALGQEVRTLVRAMESAGHKQVVWDGLDAVGNRVGSGIYFYRLEAGGRSFTKKMLMVK